jgi:hypothetical protein
MLNKSLVTQQLVDKMSGDIQVTLDQAMKEWWMNLRDHGGMRLSEVGYIAFNVMEIERWEYDLSAHKPLKASLYLALDQKLTCPYYIVAGKKAKLVLFGSREAMLLNLYGNIDQYIEMLLRQ